jgi:hypothetical protein
MSNSTVTVRPSTPSIAPTFPRSPADKAAHASASYVRPARAHDGDSDPDMDEALRRATTELAYVERDGQHGRALHEGMAAYRAWVDEDVAA